MEAASSHIAPGGGEASRDGNAAGQLRRVELLAVAFPVVLLIAFELVRALYLDSINASAEHLIAATIAIAGAIVFGLAMVTLIERAHGQMVRQNRELAAVNAVSVAVQGELAVEEIVDAALERLMASTGASDGAVTLFSHNGLSHDDDPTASDALTRRVTAAVLQSAAAAGHGRVELVEIPLSTGSSVVGRMRLTLPADAAIATSLSADALLTIGQQLACVIQARQLLDDLQRRKREGHAFYNILVEISSQNALPDILAAIVRYARDLLAADEAAMVLAEPVSRSLGTTAAAGSMAPLGDGTFCLTSTPEHFRGAHQGQAVCPIRSSPAFTSVLEVPLQTLGASLGDIWLARRSGAAYAERDRRFLATLAGLAAIAINAARAREGERQEATLAERDRIAREMHDSLAQVLGATHLRLRAVSARADLADAPGVRAEVTELADITQEAYRDVREAILGLRQASHVRGLTESLRAYLAKYSQQSGVQARLDARPEEPQLPASAEIQVIRVIQEALTNVRKHARATDVVVSITPERAGTFTEIVIEDDGCGFDLGSALLDGEGGYGLHTMRERMELVGGELRIESTPGSGTRVVARVPGPAGPTQPFGVDLAAGVRSGHPNPAR